ncbi:MAG: hypothetical protein VYE18_06095 [Pseudomonadota bacterium]|nr:hypothetical protein [Pseudomonadota bacterium]
MGGNIPGIPDRFGFAGPANVVAKFAAGTVNTGSAVIVGSDHFITGHTYQFW